MDAGLLTADLDRGYGKPAQMVQSTVTRVDPRKLSDAEIDALLAEGIGEGDEVPAADSGEPH